MTTPRILLLTLVTAGAAAAQQPKTNWIEVAQRLGGPGRTAEPTYVRLVPSSGWGPRETAPIWIELTIGGGDDVLRATIPVRRNRAAAAVDAMREALGQTAEIAVRDPFGRASTRTQVRVLVAGARDVLAGRFRSAIERIEPGAVVRIDTLGVVEHDRFEGEAGLVVRTADGERIDVGQLPERVARVDTPVRIVAHRKNARPGRFLYYGVVGNWRTVASLESIESVTPDPVPSIETFRSAAAWHDACRHHARTLLDREDHGGKRLDRPLASGFVATNDPGFAVCPRCLRPLDKDWLFADAGHDRVDATLHACARDRLYFLGRDGHVHGPFFPSSK